MKAFRWLNVLVALILLLPAGSLPGSATPLAPYDTLLLTQVGQVGGSVRAVDLQGNYVYLGVGARLVILDVTNPAFPVKLGASAQLPEPIVSLVVNGSYAYVTIPSELRVFDISSPANPLEVGVPLAMPVSGLYLDVANHRLYGVGLGQLTIVDVANPTDASILGNYQNPSYAFKDVTVLNNRAYITSSGGLLTVDVTQPLSPTLTNLLPTIALQSSEGLTALVDHLYVTSGDYGLRVLNVQNPDAPLEVGFLETSGFYSLDVRLAGNTAYLAAALGGLLAVDISNRADPQLLGRFDTPGHAWSLVLGGSLAYLTDDDGLRIVNIATPSAMTEVAQFITHGQADAVTVVGNYAYTMDTFFAGGLRTYDVTLPDQPVFSDFWFSTWGEATHASISNGRAYFGLPPSTLLVMMDLSDPARPVELGMASFNATPLAVAAYDQPASGRRFVCAAEGASGLEVMEVTIPASATIVRSLPLPAEARHLTVAGEYAYVAAGDAGVRVVSLTDPANAREVGSYTGIVDARHVTVVGNTAYVATGSGLTILDVSNKSAIALLGGYPTGAVSSVGVLGPFAFLAKGNGGIEVVDVANPSAVTFAGSVTLPGQVDSLAVADGYLYAASGEAGLIVLQVTYTSSTAISGRVLDSRGAPLPGVEITRPGSGYVALTNANGDYVFSQNPPGAYPLVPSKAGYLFEPLFRSVVLPPAASGQNFTATRVDFSTPRPLWVEPNAGANDAPQPITIYGESFQNGAQVFLDAFPLQAVNVISLTQITAEVPAGLPVGVHSLIVINPGGHEGMLPQAYTVYVNAPPQVFSVTPDQGPDDSPVMLDILGANFSPQASVTLSGTQVVDLSGVLFVDGSHLRVVVPMGLLPGTYDLLVTNPEIYVATLPAAYTVRSASEVNDLYAYDTDFWLDTPVVRPGGMVHLGLTVRRRSGRSLPDLTNVSVAFYDGAPAAGGVLIGTGTVPSLAPDQEAATSLVAWTPSQAGNYRLYAVIDPKDQVAENVESNNKVSRLVAVRPPLADVTPPQVLGLSINNGAAFTASPYVFLNTLAEDDAAGSGLAFLLFAEYEYIESTGDWVITQITDWLPAAEVSQDYIWRLSPGMGAHYLQAWAADGAGNVSLSPALQFVNYLPATTFVAQGDIHTFRLSLDAGDSLTITLASLGGDADLYVFGPNDVRVGFSELADPDVVTFTASASGLYQIEVEGYRSTYFDLSFDLNGIPLPLVSVSPDSPTGRGRVTPHCSVGDTPGGDVGLPESPIAGMVYLPLVVR